MKRVDILKELLVTIFKTTTVKISGGKIYKSGDLFSTCDFSYDFFKEYVNLCEIAFLKDKPEIKKPNYPPEDFQRADSIQRLFLFLTSYRFDFNFPNPTASEANEIAYKATKDILSAIFDKSNSTDSSSLLNEDISEGFRRSLNKIKSRLAPQDLNAAQNAIKTANTLVSFYDTDYSGDKNQYNYKLYVHDYSFTQKVPINIAPVSLKIYIDLSKNYDKNSRFFLNNLTSSFIHLVDNGEQILSFDEFYLNKPLSLTNIKSLPMSFEYVTHIDDATILNKYKCSNPDNLNEIVTEKAIKQYTDYLAPLIADYEKSLVYYTEDLIRRILSLDLVWLYNDSKKKTEKCREEVEKILIGYPEVYSYIDCCAEDIIRKQLLAILHQSIILTTSFINENGERIAKSAIKHEISKHIKYINGKIYGNKFKDLIALSDMLKDIHKDAPHSLYELYYYTSSNELADLLNSISNYKNRFKKSKKSL